jgi:NAD(P)-dependent dehydrogenase (short-subunit alcohol dehydrogenase family)
MSKILITGATSGLGRNIAEKFLAAGWVVYAHGRSPKNIRELLRNPRCHFFCTDLLEFSQLGKLASLVRREKIDCFISNAGIYADQGESIPSRLCLNLLATNLVAPVIVMKEVYAYYKSRKAGTIVSINSIAGLTANINEAVYCASKHGLRGFVKSLQTDAHRHNVRVLDYYPGAIQTRMTRKREGFGGFIKPEDVADLIVSNVVTNLSFVSVSQELRKSTIARPLSDWS